MERDGGLEIDCGRVIRSFAQEDDERDGVDRFCDDANHAIGVASVTPSTTATAPTHASSASSDGVRLELGAPPVTAPVRGGRQSAQRAPPASRSPGAWRWDPRTPATPGQFAWRKKKIIEQ